MVTRYTWLLAAAACGGNASHATPDAVGSDAAVCTTRISYGSAWIAPANHTTNYDDVNANVTWDGTCTDDGANSYATLSNGFKPYFTGHSACEIALDHSCGTNCSTRITYGGDWIPAPNHPAQYDDVDGRVFPSGGCKLSNGWAPAFTGGGCELSLRWNDCGGLYQNPVMPAGCADPGV